MFEIVLVAIIVDPTAPVHSFQARRPPTRMLRGLPLLQQLQCRDSGFVQSKSRPTQGIVTVHTRAFNQDGVQVMEFVRSALIPKRGHGVDDKH